MPTRVTPYPTSHSRGSRQLRRGRGELGLVHPPAVTPFGWHGNARHQRRLGNMKPRPTLYLPPCRSPPSDSLPCR